MHATVQKVNLSLPYCEAKTANDILVVFTPPLDWPPQLGDTLDIDLLSHDCEQAIQNLSQGNQFVATIKSNNIHDLRLPASHGTSRTPKADRIFEA